MGENNKVAHRKRYPTPKHDRRLHEAETIKQDTIDGTHYALTERQWLESGEVWTIWQPVRKPTAKDFAESRRQLFAEFGEREEG